jgi:peroxiredoxin
LIVPVAALAIAALTFYRLQRGERPLAPVPKSAADSARPAPPLSIPLSDQHRNMVKLERYYGRAPIVLVFFDKQTGAHADPYLTRLRDCFDAIQAAGTQVVGISRATPFENQQAEQRAGREFPFPLLSDVHPQGLSPAPIHIQFGLFDPTTDATRTGLFVIDRAGRIARDGERPRPVRDPDAAIEELCRGEWPLE